MELDLDRQRQAREYARTRRRLSLVSMGIAAVGIIFVFLSGLDTGLRDWLQPLTWQPISGWYPWQVLAYFLVLMLTSVVLVGRRILIGPLVGTALLIAQQNLLSLGGDWNKIILGSVLTLVLIFWPAGLVGLYRRFATNKS